MLKAEYYKAEDKKHLPNGEKELMLYQGGQFWRPEFWSREKGEWQKLKEKTSVFFRKYVDSPPNSLLLAFASYLGNELT